MSEFDRFLLAFRRDILQSSPHGMDHYARLYWDDRAAFYAQQRAAWASQQPEPFISMAKVQALNENVRAKGAGRLVHRLLGAERFKEAEDVLLDPRYRLTEGAHGLIDFAYAQIGLGRLGEATLAVERACALDPGVKGPAAQVGKVVAGINAAAERAKGSRVWADVKPLFDAWMKVGARAIALRLLLDCLPKDRPLETPEQYDFHMALDTVLSMHRPVSAYNLFRALEPTIRSMKDRGDLPMVCEALSREIAVSPPIPAPWVSRRRMLRTTTALAWGQAGMLEAAIDTLGELTVGFPKAADPRAALARFVGQYVLKTHPLRFAPAGPRKVIDVFPFNNELRLLDLKLREMADWVDVFVIVEARNTFIGTPKPLVFQENRAAFAAFESKIVHVVVDEFPPHVRQPWSREFYQRDMGVKGLDGICGEDDVVLITDADEVIAPDLVERFERQSRRGFARLAMERARYFLNYREVLAPSEQKDASSVWRGRFLGTLGLSYARNVMRWDKKAPRIAEAGWHFTSVGGATEIASKLNNSAHQEHAGVLSEEIQTMLSAIRAGRLEPGWERCELDERFPAYIRTHPQMFTDVLL
jgi:beta-1,4-mannosyl-glycoprotein beta-1,4-N-acetylglucosaminyltransferase